MPLYVGDYLADTGHLSTFEHGAYLLLLMAMWRCGGRLPNDPVKLAKHSKMTLDRWKRAAPTLLDFFTVDGSEIIHGRLAKEMSRYDGIVKARTEASHAGVQAKRLKNNRPPKPNGLRLVHQNEPNQNQTPTEELIVSSSDRSAQEALATLIEAAPPALKECGLDDDTLAFVVSRYSREGQEQFAAQFKQDTAT
jgi:uncharacterized protein YdaU (DUF1376 family)